jgi:hypothetical protein
VIATLRGPHRRVVTDVQAAAHAFARFPLVAALLTATEVRHDKGAPARTASPAAHEAPTPPAAVVLQVLSGGPGFQLAGTGVGRWW